MTLTCIVSMGDYIGTERTIDCTEPCIKGQLMRAADFVDKSLQADTADELFDLYRTAMLDLGFDRIVYDALRNAPHQPSTIPNLFHSYPLEWLEHYVQHNYMKDDPVRHKGLASRRAFVWDDMIIDEKLTKSQLKIMHEAQDAGLNDGVGLAFHGPMGETFGVGLASSTKNNHAVLNLTEIEVISTQFHILFSAKYDHPTPPCITLTPRENEVLKWAAAGKSNWSIGEILSISEHGVDFHMRNILRKLNADTRVTAIVKALHNGLLTL